MASNMLNQELGNLKESKDLLIKVDSKASKEYNDAFTDFTLENPTEISSIEKKWLNLLETTNIQLKGINRQSED